MMGHSSDSHCMGGEGICDRVMAPGVVRVSPLK